MSKRENKGRFIVFEGLEGSGKTTQLYNLQRKLLDYGIVCINKKEPSDGIIGSIAQSAAQRMIELEQETLALLFAADRVEHLVKKLIPALRSGITVLCDRYFFSTLAHQSLFVPIKRLLEFNGLVAESRMPDLTIFLDVPPRVCSDRLSAWQLALELNDDVNTLSMIRENYFEIFEAYRDKTNICVVDGTQSIGDVSEIIWNEASKLFDLEQSEFSE